MPTMDGYDAVNRVFWPATGVQTLGPAAGDQRSSRRRPPQRAMTVVRAQPRPDTSKWLSSGSDRPAACAAMQSLLDEISLSTGYLESLYPDGAIQRIVFVGGEARMADACEAISTALGIPAQIASPLRRSTRRARATTPTSHPAARLVRGRGPLRLPTDL